MPTTERRVRVDAARNRDRLVAAARQAYEQAGDGRVSLEAVARAAGVGVGTLYRHFPSREALVEAVYEAELDDLATGAGPLLGEHRADIALRAWMDRYAAFVATKRGMIDVLRAGWAAGTVATPDTRGRITAAIATILGDGVRQGVLRDDVTADDVTAAVFGVFLSTAVHGTPEQAGRLLDLIVDGLRPPGRE